MDTPHSRILLLIGVTGSGKAAVGKLLQSKTQWPFYDGDDFQPEANLKKIQKGSPLTDEDRVPWLLAVREEITRYLEEGKSAIFACSALKESSREILRRDDRRIHVIYLKGAPEEIQKRMAQRPELNVTPERLKSQFDILEEPEDALVYPVSQYPDQIVSQIMQTFVKKSYPSQLPLPLV